MKCKNSRTLLSVAHYVVDMSLKYQNKKARLSSNHKCFFAGAKSFSEAMKMGTEVYHHLKSVIKKRYGQDGM